MSPSPRSFVVYAVALCAALASAPRPFNAQDAPAANIPTIRTSTQVVIVDVTVTDGAGKPIHGLKPGDLILTEDKAVQHLRNFEEHRADQPAPNTALPPMPPGVFTNYTPVPPDDTLNVILIDSLNTPMVYQNYLRKQLAEYAKSARPGARVAVFGLSNRLYLLQGFTSDPATLRSVLERKSSAHASRLLDDPVGTNADQVTLAGMAQDAGLPSGTVASVEGFENIQKAYQTNLRIRVTMDAFNAIAHYLAGFTGRKNLIWFSGAFPISLSPDPRASSPFAVTGNMQREFEETTNLFARGQVTVYPIDARGLMVAPMLNAANTGGDYKRNPGAFDAALHGFSQDQFDEHGFSQSQFEEHAAMDQMADATGGKAFYNTNGLADATAQAMQLGANYYTLAYSPSNRTWDGKFRSIKVSLSEAAKGHGYKLTYRPGYFALDAASSSHHAEAASVNESRVSVGAPSASVAKMMMERGAPEPQDLLVKVRVLPQSTEPTNKLAVNNVVTAAKAMKAPYRNYAVDLVASAGDFAMQRTSDGHYTDTVQVKIFVYNAEGELLNVAALDTRMNLTAEVYQNVLKNGVRYKGIVSAPAKGESFLRIGIMDGNSGRLGAVEISTAVADRLASNTVASQSATQVPSTKEK